MGKSKARSRFMHWYRAPLLEQLFWDKISLSKAVGRDGIRLAAFETKLSQEIDLIRRKVFASQYTFTRYKERLISKGAGKPPRLLSIPTFRDRLTLRALCEFLGEMYPEAAINKPHVYIKEIRDLVAGKSDDWVFIKVDIEDYYGTIDRKLLLRAIRRKIRIKDAIALISSAISAPTLKEAADSGIPQGLSISNILASIYLHDVDELMGAEWNYFRYVDDILMIVPRDQADLAFKALLMLLKKKRLKAHPLGPGSKTRIVPLSEGVDYLGFEIKPTGLSIRESSFKKMFGTLNAVFTSAKYKKRNDHFVWRLNLKITGCRLDGKQYGWVSFFRQSENIRQFARLDYFVEQQLKRYGLRHLQPRIKTFVRAYHEIRYELETTRYIPNFDAYDLSEMTQYLVSVQGKDISGWSDEKIEQEFMKIMKREAGKLEKDLFEFFS